MKKQLMTTIMVLGLAAALSACGTGSAGNASNNVAETETQIANPWTEVSTAELAEAVGTELSVPDGATEVTYRLLSESALGEADFSYYGLEFTARVQKTDALEDISGLYYDWTVTNECVVNGCEGESRRFLGENETVDLILWYDAENGFTHSLSTQDKDLDGFDIQAVAERM